MGANEELISNRAYNKTVEHFANKQDFNTYAKKVSWASTGLKAVFKAIATVAVVGYGSYHTIPRFQLEFDNAWTEYTEKDTTPSIQP